MITIPMSTPEKPLTAIDYIAALEQADSITQVQEFSRQVPENVRTDERFTKAVARRLATIKDRKAAA